MTSFGNHNGDGNGNVGSPSIEHLPDECLSEILKRLPGVRERSSSACVSKRWLSLLCSIRASDFCMNNNQVTENNDEYFDNDDITSLSDEEEVDDGYLERTLVGMLATDIALAGTAIGSARRGGLGKLSIRGSDLLRGVTNYGLSAIGHGCPLLKNLLLFNISTIGDDGLVEIANGCPLLEMIDLSQCPTLTNRGLVAIACTCTNLTTLNIDSCSNIGNMSLRAIGKYCSKIQSVAIKNCPLIDDQGVAGLVSAASAVLTSLKLQLLNISGLSISVIGYFGQALRSLELCGLQYTSEEGFLSMDKCRCLRLLVSLTLTSCDGVSDLSLEMVGKACPKLKHVFLIKCYVLSNDGLVAFTKVAPSLESLLLEQCHMITQIGVLYALSFCISKLMKSLSIIECLGIRCMSLRFQTLSPCPSLRSLCILSSPGFTGYSLGILGKLCPGLHKLDLTGLAEITDEALMPFIESLQPRLAEVDLCRCVNLTDKSIVALVKIHGKTLKTLNLEGCKNVTDESMKAIAYYCIVINDLDLSECSITDIGLAAVCDEVHGDFQALSISGCSMITDTSVYYIKMLSVTLSALNIKKCKSLSKKGIKELRKELQTCDILS